MTEHIYEDSDMESERYHVIPFGWKREEIVRCRDCMYAGGDATYCTEGCCDESDTATWSLTVSAHGERG